MRFTRKHDFIVFDYMLNSSSLHVQSSFSDLGIILDSKLSFTDHYDSIIKKANRSLGFIKRFGSEFRDPFVIKCLFFSFARSVLEYGCVIWAPYYNVHTNRIESVQKKFIKFYLRFLPRSNLIEWPSYPQNLILLNIPSLSAHREFLQLCFIVGLMNGSISSFSVLGRLNFNAARVGLRTRLPIRPSFSRSNYGSNSPINQLINIFNKHYNLIDSVNVNIKSKQFKIRFFVNFVN